MSVLFCQNTMSIAGVKLKCPSGGPIGDTAKVVMMALLMASVSLAGCFGEEAKEEVEIPVVEDVFRRIQRCRTYRYWNQRLSRQIPPE